MKKILLSISVLVIAIAVHAQEAKVKLKLAKGDKYKIEMSSKSNSTVEAGGQEMKTTIEVATGQLFEVISVDGDKYTLSVVNDGVIGKMSMMGNDDEINTAKGDGFSMMGGIPKFMKSAAGYKYEMVVNEQGALLSSKGFEKLTKPSKEESAGMSMMGGGLFSNITDSGMINLTLSAFKQVAKGTYKVGDAWDEKITLSKSPLVYNYKVETISGNEMNLKVSGKNKISNKISGPMGEAEIAGDNEDSGTAVVNTATGITTSQKRLISSKMTISMGGNEMPQSSETTSEVKVTKQ